MLILRLCDRTLSPSSVSTQDAFKHSTNAHRWQVRSTWSPVYNRKKRKKIA